MQCPSCKETIDDDSCYCDQCGEQILICSECGLPGTRKFCNHDGKPMIPAGSQITPAFAPVQSSTPVAAPAQPSAPMQTPPVTPVQSTPQPQSVSSARDGDTVKDSRGGSTIKFSGNGIKFEAKDGDIIGRKTGSFIGIFATYQCVSGTHCKVIKMPNGWHIQDLGSTNGTYVQGTQLLPNVPYLLTNNDKVEIATKDTVFTVTF